MQASTFVASGFMRFSSHVIPLASNLVSGVLVLLWEFPRTMPLFLQCMSRRTSCVQLCTPRRLWLQRSSKLGCGLLSSPVRSTQRGEFAGRLTWPRHNFTSHKWKLLQLLSRQPTNLPASLEWPSETGLRPMLCWSRSSLLSSMCAGMRTLCPQSSLFAEQAPHASAAIRSLLSCLLPRPRLFSGLLLKAKFCRAQLVSRIISLGPCTCSDSHIMHYRPPSLLHQAVLLDRLSFWHSPERCTPSSCMQGCILPHPWLLGSRQQAGGARTSGVPGASFQVLPECCMSSLLKLLACSRLPTPSSVLWLAVGTRSASQHVTRAMPFPCHEKSRLEAVALRRLFTDCRAWPMAAEAKLRSLPLQPSSRSALEVRIVRQGAPKAIQPGGAVGCALRLVSVAARTDAMHSEWRALDRPAEPSRCINAAFSRLFAQCFAHPLSKRRFNAIAFAHSFRSWHCHCTRPLLKMMGHRWVAKETGAAQSRLQAFTQSIRALQLATSMQSVCRSPRHWPCLTVLSPLQKVLGTNLKRAACLHTVGCGCRHVAWTAGVGPFFRAVRLLLAVPLGCSAQLLLEPRGWALARDCVPESRTASRVPCGVRCDAGVCKPLAAGACQAGIWKAPSPNVASPATSRHEVSWTSKFACPASHNKTRGKLSFPVSSDACLASMVALPWAWRPIGCSLAQSESPSKSWKPLQALCLRSLTWPSEFQAIILAPEHGPFLRLKLPLRHRAGVALMAMHTQSPSNLGHWLLGMLIQPAQAECDQQVSFLDPVPHFELGQLRPLRLSSDTCARCLRLDVALALRTVWQAARLGFRVGRVERHVLHFVCQWQWVQRPKSPAWWTLRHALAPGSRTTNFVRATSGARYPKDCSARKALQGQMVRCAMVRLQGETEHPVLNSGNTRVMVVVREAWAWFNFGAAETMAALHIPGAFAQRLEFQTWSFACYGFRHVRTACGWQAVACLQGSAHIFLGQLCFAHSLSSLQSVCQAKGRANIVWVKAQHFVQAQPRTKLMACLFATLALHQQLRFAELWQAIRRTEVLIRRRPLLAVLLAPAALKPAAKRSHQARIRQAEPAVRQFCDAPLASTRLIPAKVCLHGNMPRIDIHAVLQGGLPVGRMLPSITLSVQQQFFLANQETKFFVCLQRIARRSLPARLIRAAVAVLQLRHSVLRTSFVLNKHGGFQQQNATCLLDDAVEVCHVQTDAEAMKRAHEFAHALMDLQQVPIRVLCVEICGESPETSKTMIVLKVHHIAIDGRSMAMLDAQLCELVELGLENDAGLEAKKASRYYLCTLVTSELLQLLEFFFHGGYLPEDIPQYADYVTWVQDYMRSAEYQLDLAHWTAQLGSVSSLPVLSIPVDKPRPRHSGLDAHVGIVDVHFPDDFLGRFKSTDAFPFVLTIFAMALCLWSRQDAVVIGSPVFGVPSVDFARVVGCTSHLIPYVIQMPRPFSLPKLLRALCDMVSSAMKHGTVPLQESPLWPGNTDASQPHPLYQVIVTWQPRGGWARRGKSSDAWEMKQFIGPSPLMADLVLDAYEKDKIVPQLNLEDMKIICIRL